jgi:hypothetical protein
VETDVNNSKDSLISYKNLQAVEYIKKEIILKIMIVLWSGVFLEKRFTSLAYNWWS